MQPLSSLQTVLNCQVFLTIILEKRHTNVMCVRSNLLLVPTLTDTCDLLRVAILIHTCLHSDSIVIIRIIHRKPVLTDASVVCGGMLASMNLVNSVNSIYEHWQSSYTHVYTYWRKAAQMWSLSQAAYSGSLKRHMLTHTWKCHTDVTCVRSSWLSQANSLHTCLHVRIHVPYFWQRSAEMISCLQLLRVCVIVLSRV